MKWLLVVVFWFLAAAAIKLVTSVTLVKNKYPDKRGHVRIVASHSVPKLLRSCSNPVLRSKFLRETRGRLRSSLRGGQNLLDEAAPAAE